MGHFRSIEYICAFTYISRYYKLWPDGTFPQYRMAGQLDHYLLIQSDLRRFHVTLSHHQVHVHSAPGVDTTHQVGVSSWHADYLCLSQWGHSASQGWVIIGHYDESDIGGGKEWNGQSLEQMIYAYTNVQICKKTWENYPKNLKQIYFF